MKKTASRSKQKAPASAPKEIPHYSSIVGCMISTTDSTEETCTEASRLFAEGILCHSKKNFESAYDKINRAYQLFTTQKDSLRVIECLIEMGWIKYRSGKEGGSKEGGSLVVKSRNLFDEAETMINAHINDSGVQELQARLLHYQGLVQYGESNYGEGVRLFRQALTFSRPEELESARIHDSLAIYYERTGDFHRAIDCLKKALRIKRNCRILHEEAITCQIFGRLYSRIEDYEHALLYIRQSIAIVEKLKDEKRLLSLRNELIKIYIDQNDLEKAEILVAEALSSPLKTENNAAFGLTYLYQAFLLLQEKKLKQAERILEENVFNVFEKSGFQKGTGIALRIKASIESRKGNVSGAFEHLSQAVAIFKELRECVELTKTFFEIGRVYDRQSDPKNALKYFLEALKTAETNGLKMIASYLEDEIYRVDVSQWKEIVNKRANHERIFEKEPNLLDALSALSEGATAIEHQDGSGMAVTIGQGKLHGTEAGALNPLISLLRVGQAMSGERDLERLLTLIREETEKSLNADRCTVFLYDRDRNELWSKVASGLDKAEEIRFPAHLGLAGYVCKTGEVLNIQNAYEDPRFNKEIDKKTGYITKNLLCMPMLNRNNEIIGVFQVLNKMNSHFKKTDEDLLMAIAASAAVAIENAKLATDQKVAFESFIKTLSSTIDARDPITAGHSERVAEYSSVLGEQMRLNHNDLEVLKYAALLHDIGKIGIREDILVKDGRLTQKEYRHIQKHAYYTYEILKNIHFENHLRLIPDIAAVHHEKMDGSGYFRGLKGDDIPISGRILALSDVFDAITSRRHYRNRMPFNKVLQVLRRDSGSHFDPDCVDSFLNVKLRQVGNILLMDQPHIPMENSVLQKSSILKDLDPEITLGEYEAILEKSRLTKAETKVHQVFSSLYNCVRISDFD